MDKSFSLLIFTLLMALYSRRVVFILLNKILLWKESISIFCQLLEHLEFSQIFLCACPFISLDSVYSTPSNTSLPPVSDSTSTTLLFDSNSSPVFHDSFIND